MLDTCVCGGYRDCMAQSILVFDFGTNEEAAQQARHKVDAWRQGFRLGNKMRLKFERMDASEDGGTEETVPSKESVRGMAAGKKSSAKEAKAEKETPPGSVRLLVRLDFSDHEKLSHQRWLDRIPVEEPFKSATSRTLRAGDPEFAKTAELFESLD